MKIIRHGNVPELVKDMIAQCQKCGCVFLFKKHEASKKHSNNGGGTVYYADCPEPSCDEYGSFDTGYPRDNDRDRELNERVIQRQSALRLIAEIHG